ncbi:unnamed protein product [Lactuca virosa]|uniref:RIN4 pathogenic type III effector avirulence factor Avr cleavage site domain-containing protein n=1 Tax=Lactuca virosa TaxID=75947 RepID=A0AAU9NZZ8_9ASTR|nr:unnamed protein product [Lactuca virosa]
MPGKSWAEHCNDKNPQMPDEQWDRNAPMPASFNYMFKKKTSNGGGAMAVKYENTKQVAVNCAKLVKQGTFAGMQWIKDKYQKPTQKR